jgi:hypothetical protein
MSISTGCDERDLLNRRTFMGATAGAFVLPLLRAPALASSVHAFRHGAFDIRVFSDGHMIVPASMLAIGAPADKLEEVLRRTDAPAPMAWPAPPTSTRIRSPPILISGIFARRKVSF